MSAHTQEVTLAIVAGIPAIGDFVTFPGSAGGEVDWLSYYTVQAEVTDAGTADQLVHKLYGLTYDTFEVRHIPGATFADMEVEESMSWEFVVEPFGKVGQMFRSLCVGYTVDSGVVTTQVASCRVAP